jgi:hypothetical protein
MLPLMFGVWEENKRPTLKGTGAPVQQPAAAQAARREQAEESVDAQARKGSQKRCLVLVTFRTVSLVSGCALATLRPNFEAAVLVRAHLFGRHHPALY